MKNKVGKEYSKNVGRSLPFASVVDGITFGIVDGIPFDTAKLNWEFEDKVKWAEGNAKFFEALAGNLRLWIKAGEIRS